MQIICVLRVQGHKLNRIEIQNRIIRKLKFISIMDISIPSIGIKNSTKKSYDLISIGEPDYTLTFVIGFCVLAVFLILGIVASTYLCVTLKKGTRLWATDGGSTSRRLNPDNINENGGVDEKNKLVGGRGVRVNVEQMVKITTQEAKKNKEINSQQSTSTQI